MIGFLLGNWQRLAIYAVVAAAVLGVTWMHGLFTGRAALHEYKAEQAQEAVKIVVKQGAVTERVVTKYVKVAGETKTKIEVREKEVIRYENAKLDQCPLSVGFVSLHDSAALDILPDAARSTDGTASGIATAKALPTIEANYSTCHQTAIRLRSLQEWIREQQKVAP